MGKATPLQCLEDGIMSYWYEKIESRPGRKIGHIAVYGANRRDFENRWQSAKNALQNWHHIHSS
jgi:phosphoribosylaminoimidazole carboxylase (NCAIR synthetase)